MMDIQRLFIFVLSCDFIQSFNIDTEKGIIYRGTTLSQFGATTEIVQNSQGKWLIVGAPRQNFTSEPLIIKPGTIYRCPITTTSTVGSGCTAINIRADIDSSRYPPLKAEENQGLGLNMLVSGSTMVVCSPQWKQLISPTTYYSYGKCSEVPVATLNQNTNKLFTVDNNNRFLNSRVLYASAKFGHSSANTIHSNYPVVIGIPNAYGAGGGFALYSTATASSFYLDYNVGQHARSENLDFVFRTGSYLGYSVGNGNLDPNGNFVIVAGAPGYVNNEGTVGSVNVLFWTGSDITLRKQIAGKVLGGGFGQTLCVADFNGDNRDDVVVGAPLEYGSNTDEGAVYVYYGTGTATYIANEQKLQGSGNPNARFGYSIVNMGDINKDNFNDLAVGAPFENNNMGAIYIFNGGSSGVKTPYTQRILSSNIGPGIKGFGFSISKNRVDVDDNSYNDISVGAFLSDQTVVLRTRAIVTITATISLSPMVMPLNSSGYSCRGNSFNPCTSVQVCLRYSGSGAGAGVYLNYTLKSDVGDSVARRSRFDLYASDTNSGATYTKPEVYVADGTQVCETIQARVNSVNRDFFLLVQQGPVFEVEHSVSEKAIPGVRPIHNEGTPNTKRVTGSFLTQCGDGCSPNLRLTAKVNTPTVVLGQTQEMELEFFVINLADPAYGASVLITTDYNVPFVSYVVLLEQGSDRMTCRAETVQGVQMTRCSFEEPLFPQQKGLFRVRFDVSSGRLIPTGNLQNLADRININASAEVTSEADQSDNNVQAVANIELRSNIEIIGSTLPDQVKLTEEKNTKVHVAQIYSILNQGPSPLPEVSAVFRIPVMAGGKSLMMSQELELTAMLSGDSCRRTYFPTPEFIDQSVAKPPPIGIPPERTQTIRCSDADVECAVYECSLTSLQLFVDHTFSLSANVSESSLPEFQAGIAQMNYYTSGIVYPSTRLRVPLALDKNASFAAALTFFPQNVVALTEEINLWPVIVGCIVGILVMVLLGVVLWKLGFFKRKKREQLLEYKRKSYAHERQSRALLRATRELGSNERKILSQYQQLDN